jgi:hypothetical protein
MLDIGQQFKLQSNGKETQLEILDISREGWDIQVRDMYSGRVYCIDTPVFFEMLDVDKLVKL